MLGRADEVRLGVQGPHDRSAELRHLRQRLRRRSDLPGRTVPVHAPACSPATGPAWPRDASHCGSCTTTCAGAQVCSNNSCQSSCGAGETPCSGGACVKVTNNALNCGACGNACPAGSVCNGGVCGCSAAGQMLCGSACIDVMSDNDHCGGCNRPCNGTCTNGACVSHAGRHGAVAAQHPPHDQRRVRRLGAGAARDHQDAEHDVPARLAPARRLHAERRAAHQSGHGEGPRRCGPRAGRRGPDRQQAAGPHAPAGCASPTAANAESCATGYINEFGAKAFRRPVANSETTDLMAVYRIGAASPGTYAEGIDLVTRAILQAPGFLYLTALGPAGQQRHDHADAAGAGDQPVVPGRRGTARSDAANGDEHARRTGPRRRARRRCAGCSPRRPGAIAWCAWCASGWASTASRRPPRTPRSTRTSSALRPAMQHGDREVHRRGRAAAEGHRRRAVERGLEPSTARLAPT